MTTTNKKQATKTNASATAKKSENCKKSTSKLQTACTYAQRMQANKKALQSLSKMWKSLQDPENAFANAIPTSDNARNDFFAHMKSKYPKLAVSENPKRGWSVWYALQWVEQQVKEAAKDEKHPNHVQAVEYLQISLHLEQAM